MDVLIIAANRYKQPVPVMPIGACIVAEAVEQAGHNVRLLDLMFEDNPLSALVRELKQAKPDVIGISIRNIDNNNMNHPMGFIDELLPIIKIIRQMTEALIVLGGAAVSLMPEEFLRLTHADYAVTGKGETVFPELLSRLSGRGIISGIPGLIRIYNDTLIKNHQNKDTGSGLCHSPDFPRWLETKTYRANFSAAPIQSKRGCPYNCIYCTYAINEGREYQLCEPASVADAVRKLHSSGITDIEFVDNVFNSPYSHAVEICKSIITSKIKARLHTMELNPRFVDKPLIDLMEKAGFVAAGITAESASDGILSGLRKGFNKQDICKAAKLSGRSKIPYLWIFLLGGPGETEESIKETLSFAEQHINRKDTVLFNVGIRIYPGTEIDSLARRQGLLNLTAKEMLKPVSYFSPLLNKTWLAKTLEKIISRNLNFISINSLSESYLGKINRLAYRLGIKPPVWKHTRFLRAGLKLVGATV